MYSVMIARYKYFPEVKTKGMSAAPRLVLFTSEHVRDHEATRSILDLIKKPLSFIDCRLRKSSVIRSLRVESIHLAFLKYALIFGFDFRQR